MKRKGLLYFSIILVGFVFLTRLFYLQVLDNVYHNPIKNNSAVKVKYSYPERGYIYDRNGVLLVANQL
jgi:penicillin-binding protein 2